MQFLDKIKELEETAAALQSTIQELQKQAINLQGTADNLSDVLGAATRQLGEVQQAIAGAPVPFTIEISQNGQDFTVSEKDGLVLFAALTAALDHKEPSVKLASGQTVKLRLTDVEQVAQKILEATK